ncbi:MAG TPA: NAD(P)H-dependent oxidoreductase [Kiritimatiellia bacterium]|nr:NAD(P)H-dependent oxidoreductase [Kiritimatiellia bacterium]HMO98049.1 NAD(P)H-dependent oxidoreductase [Kiritimatiellia bacterium]HMP97397.1 NAD(P)H-dependent oxidoreductase [Kiritimatiellia bacterium]
MKKNVMVIIGHPRRDSLCDALAEAYGRGAAEAGHTVTHLRLGALNFDPVLHAGYTREQPLEPDLLKAQEHIRNADHLVFVFPVWWGGLPALLKGFIDRVLLPGFAFKYHKNSPWWDRLLTGRSAELWMTMDAPAWYYRWVVRRPAYHQMKTAILGFCGITLTRTVAMGPVKGSTEARREKWLNHAYRKGRAL